MTSGVGGGAASPPASGRGGWGRRAPSRGAPAGAKRRDVRRAWASAVSAVREVMPSRDAPLQSSGEHGGDGALQTQLDEAVGENVLLSESLAEALREYHTAAADRQRLQADLAAAQNRIAALAARGASPQPVARPPSVVLSRAARAPSRRQGSAGNCSELSALEDRLLRKMADGSDDVEHRAAAERRRSPARHVVPSYAASSRSTSPRGAPPQPWPIGKHKPVPASAFTGTSDVPKHSVLNGAAVMLPAGPSEHPSPDSSSSVRRAVCCDAAPTMRDVAVGTDNDGPPPERARGEPQDQARAPQSPCRRESEDVPVPAPASNGPTPAAPQVRSQASQEGGCRADPAAAAAPPTATAAGVDSMFGSSYSAVPRADAHPVRGRSPGTSCEVAHQGGASDVWRDGIAAMALRACAAPHRAEAQLRRPSSTTASLHSRPSTPSNRSDGRTRALLPSVAPPRSPARVERQGGCLRTAPPEQWRVEAAAGRL
eukprot:TRINITY_DN17834_c0_g1_i1.p1 TRINITY_DN17834_c0_g1~~TRINITY_DN17834_c0_g1_i1.p1  ORF type:complete len:486 (+),score=36.46 TRINITY_DN17834_c0_g1_i1:120-1577(+)